MATTFTFDGTAAAAGGLITQEEIFKAALKKLGGAGRGVKDIELELRSVLYDLAGRDKFLEGSDTVTTEAGTAGYDEPELIKKITEVYIDGGQHLTEGSYKEYRQDIEDQSSPTTGEPERWCRFNGEIIFYDPVPGDEYIVTIDFYKYHGKSTATIEFAERFREAILQGVLYQLYTGQLKKDEDAAQQAIIHRQLYEDEINIQGANQPSEPVVTEYRDI